VKIRVTDNQSLNNSAKAHTKEIMLNLRNQYLEIQKALLFANALDETPEANYVRRNPQE
jgi:hypothetical protein